MRIVAGELRGRKLVAPDARDSPARRPTRSARRCSTRSPASTSSSAPPSPTSTPAAARWASRRCRAAPSTARSSSATAARSSPSTTTSPRSGSAAGRKVIVGDGVAAAPRLDADLVFADPPYEFDDWPRLLRAVRAPTWSSPRPTPRWPAPTGWEQGRVKRYGRTWVTFLHRDERRLDGGAAPALRLRHPWRPCSTPAASIRSTSGTSTWSSRRSSSSATSPWPSMHNHEKPGGLFTVDERLRLIREPVGRRRHRRPRRRRVARRPGHRRRRRRSAPRSSSRDCARRPTSRSSSRWR